MGTEHSESGARRAPSVPRADGPPLMQGCSANKSDGESRWTDSATRWQEEANAFVRAVVEIRSADLVMMMGAALSLRLVTGHTRTHERSH